MKVFASIVIDKPAQMVWNVMRDFVGLTAWSNAVTSAQISNAKASDQIGAIRRLEIVDGSVFTETLLALSDVQMILKYDIVEGPIPVEEYIATMQVYPVTATDASYLTWSAEFLTPDDQTDAMREVVGEQICAGGLLALKSYMERSN
ncbi:MAG: hypothetical protein ACI915_001199 [Gammaproteobacteria bacterium]|jgi:hypothetical protein